MTTGRDRRPSRVSTLIVFATMAATTYGGALLIDHIYGELIDGSRAWACAVGSFAAFQALLFAMFAVPGAGAASLGRALLGRLGQPPSTRSLIATILLIAAVPYLVLSLTPIGCV